MPRKYHDLFYCVRKNTRLAAVIQELYDEGLLSWSEELQKWRLGPYSTSTAIATVHAMYGYGAKKYKLKSEIEVARQKGIEQVKRFKEGAGML